MQYPDPATFLPDEIEAPRMVLRMPRRSDAGLIGLYAGDQRVARMTTSIPHPYPPGGAEDFIDGQVSGRRRGRSWVMDGTPSSSSEVIGMISAHAVEGAAFEIGYWVGPPFWNTGYAGEALRALIDPLFESGAEQLVAQVFCDNPISDRVVTRAGFAPVAELEVFSVARGGLVAARRYTLDQAARK